MAWCPVASFIKEVNPRLAKRPLVFNGRLANRGLTSLVKEATVTYLVTLIKASTCTCHHTDNCYMYLCRIIIHTYIIRKNRDFMETLYVLIALCEGNPPVILTKVH